MNFTDKTNKQQLKYIKYIYKVFNNDLFNNNLPDDDAIMLYNTEDIHPKMTGLCIEYMGVLVIIISENWINNELKNINELDQYLNIYICLLHEMIHKYNRYNMIDDENHNENYANKAAELGYIIRTDESGELQEDLTESLKAYFIGLYKNDN